jgi:HAD superfamily hydrolase (TIGR01509 family)
VVPQQGWPAVTAVIFDMDGVLLDSEPLWDAARERLARESGGRWSDTAQREMMGMSSPEWSRYMHEELAVPLEPARISEAVVRAMEDLYRERLPLVDGAVEAVERLSRFTLGLASSANRRLIDLALELSGLARRFAATVSSEEVERGKPAPDVYLEAARRVGEAPQACAAVEDSGNGILSARAAAMRVVAVPGRAFPPDPEALGQADAVLGSLAELEPSTVEALFRPRGRRG